MRWRKSGAEGAQIGTSLPKRHPSRAAQLLKKPGKIGRTAEKIGCRIGKLSVRENRRCTGVFEGDPSRKSGGGCVPLGRPPRDPEDDWVALVDSAD